MGLDNHVTLMILLRTSGLMYASAFHAVYVYER